MEGRPPSVRRLEIACVSGLRGDLFGSDLDIPFDCKAYAPAEETYEMVLETGRQTSKRQRSPSCWPWLV